MVRVLDSVPAGLEGAVDALADEFAGVFARESIAACVADSLAQLQPARVEAFLPLLAHRFARERLRATALVQGRLPRTTPVVLFVCTHNAGRSQLAAALLAYAAHGTVTVLSAGTQPAAEVEPAVIQVLAEIGADTSEAFPKPLTDELMQAADVVITMGCGDACPVLPGPRYVDWNLPDPAGADLATVRQLRTDIDTRVRTLLTEIAPAATTVQVTH